MPRFTKRQREDIPDGDPWGEFDPAGVDFIEDPS